MATRHVGEEAATLDSHGTYARWQTAGQANEETFYLGAEDYRAPEVHALLLPQISRRAIYSCGITKKADVWSAGVLLFELLTGTTEGVRAVDIHAQWVLPKLPLLADARLCALLRCMLIMDPARRPSCEMLLKSKAAAPVVIMALEYNARRPITVISWIEYSSILLLYVSELSTFAIRLYLVLVGAVGETAASRLDNSLFWNAVVLQFAINAMCFAVQVTRIALYRRQISISEAVPISHAIILAIPLFLLGGLEGAEGALTNSLLWQLGLDFFGYTSLSCFWEFETHDSRRDVAEMEIVRRVRFGFSFLHAIFAGLILAWNFFCLSKETSASLGVIFYYAVLAENWLLLELVHVVCEVVTRDIRHSRPDAHFLTHFASALWPCTLPHLNYAAPAFFQRMNESRLQSLEYVIVSTFYMTELVTANWRQLRLNGELYGSPPADRYLDNTFVILEYTQLAINFVCMVSQILRTVAAGQRTLAVSVPQFVVTLLCLAALVSLECSLCYYSSWKWIWQALLDLFGYLTIILFWSVEMSITRNTGCADTEVGTPVPVCLKFIRRFFVVLHISFFGMIMYWSIQNISKISASSSAESALMYTADLWETILILEILHSIADVFLKDSGKKRHVS